MKLILVTNKNLARIPYLDVIEQVCKAGIDGIIFREIGTDKSLLNLALEVKNITDYYSVPLAINSHYNLYMELDADFYHSKEKDFCIKGVITSNQGVSIHSLNNAKEAKNQGAKYILAGHIFDTRCKEGLTPRGLSFLDEITSLNIPTLAIGGVNQDTLPLLLDKSIYGVAIMSEIMSSQDPFNTVKNLKTIIGG